MSDESLWFAGNLAPRHPAIGAPIQRRPPLLTNPGKKNFASTPRRTGPRVKDNEADANPRPPPVAGNAVALLHWKSFDFVPCNSRVAAHPQSVIARPEIKH